MTYKEVFQLAQDKGYKPFHNVDRITAANKHLIYAKLLYMELTLIQKWLRDEHKTYVLVEWQHAKYFWAVVKSNNSDYETENCKNGETYEQALLEGINEALKLIEKTAHKFI